MNLFWKLFITFGIAMALTLVGAIYLSFRLTSLAFDQYNIENREITIDRATRAVAEGGRQELTRWLRQNPAPAPGILVMVIDESDADLLGRELPSRFEPFLNPRSSRRNYRPNFRPPQLTATVVAPSGEEFRLLFVRTRITVLGLLTWPATQLAVLSLAIIAAAITSFLLARYLSLPIMRLQRASRALAAGALETRVGSPFVKRKDEVGTLARDFDTMATKIQALVNDKEVLMRDVSHELRSPLARIRVALALAQRRAGDGSQPDLDRIELETERLDELIGQILTLSRLRSEPGSHAEDVDIDRLVREIVEDAEFELAAKRVDLDVQVIPDIHCNRSEIASAIENVLRNALIHSESTDRVRVRLRRSRSGIEIAIADRGTGVAENAIERIFEPFLRLDESRNHKQKGYGLGLAIAASVIKRHKGEISARNRKGGGLEVLIWLPAG